ncbi:MAG: ATP-dependent RNA helicase HrpA, partial [Micrococcales bacterium]|nr:ATP-dependent RNA helicase HrpA [Micrococcales bacterium]
MTGPQQPSQPAGPVICFPPELPVSARRQQIAAAIAKHQVVIVSGETGSGKTTQLPKILLQMGRGKHAMIGHTQPRRIAARSVAERISEELGTELGGLVGYQMRFTDHTGPNTRLKVMTDGILLAQIQRDPRLLAYDTIIIDEAHERSLNIDFLLGYLSNLLPRRPDLKLIITSATIDSELFAKHYGRSGRPAPVIKVTGRTYPVEVRYRPLAQNGGPEDQTAGIVAAARELMKTGPGDVLVFCSGEREIKDTTQALIRQLGAVGVDDAGAQGNLEVLPLYSRLSAAEQHRVFERHNRRRIVVATNVAETSLTVPGVHFVIDPGTARISRYSKATKVQRLPIEPISQASANQRAGRCGRIAKGVCIRLYSEADFLARPQFTEPEILRTSLASVILQMIAVGVAASPGDVSRFPFVQKPDSRNVQDGVRTLEELAAIETTSGQTRLTPVGRRLANLPIDPRLGRMMLAAEALGVTAEVTVLAAALSIQDVRERPAEALAQADQCHARFKHPTSDYLGLLKLWDYLRQLRRTSSGSAFRRQVRSEYLNYLRVREWQDLVAELRRALKQSPGRASKPRRRDQTAGHAAVGEGLTGVGEGFDYPDADWIHKAVLTGLVSQIGQQRATTVGVSKPQDDPRRASKVGRTGRNDYVGPRGANFAIFPGSALFQRPPDWVMAAELVETSRLWARTCAKIDPGWVEQVAPHLARFTYHNSRWSAKLGSAQITEKVLVYGLPVVAGRSVPLSQVDRQLARELFIRHALVQGEWRCDHHFWLHNQRLLDKLDQAFGRSKRSPAPLSDDDLFQFFAARIPDSVLSVRHFDSWWSKASRQDPELLNLDESVLVGNEQDLGAGFPDVWRKGGFELPISYRHSPGTDDDGVTVHLPVDLANQISSDGFDWQVPGLRLDLVTALIKSLPKRERAGLLPAADTARQALLALGDPTDWLDANGRVMPLAQALSQVMAALRGVQVPVQAWAEAQLPGHLLVRFVVEDAKGQVMA